MLHTPLSAGDIVDMTWTNGHEGHGGITIAIEIDDLRYEWDGTHGCDGERV